MYHYAATIIRIVDGDTFDAAVDLGFYLTARLRFRIVGMNAPELHGPGKDLGLAAKAALESLLPVGRTAELWTYKGDSFGRWLADVAVADPGAATLVDIAGAMIAAGHAVPMSREGLPTRELAKP